MANPNGGGSGNGSADSGGNSSPSYMGGSTPDTFDPKAFGTKLFSDASRVYDQGPKNNPIADFTDFSGATKGLIQQGQDNNTNLRNGLTGQVANGAVGSANPFYLSGPDYTKGYVGDVASGKYLEKGGNPFLEKALSDSRDNILRDVGSQFTNSGRFGGGSYVDTAVDSLASNENTARLGQYNTDYSNMLQALGLQSGQADSRRGQFDNEYARKVGAQGQLDASTAQALGYSSLLDSKAAEKNASDKAMWTIQNDPNYAHISKYIDLLTGGQANENTNRPVGLWDIIGGIGSAAGALL